MIVNPRCPLAVLLLPFIGTSTSEAPLQGRTNVGLVHPLGQESFRGGSVRKSVRFIKLVRQQLEDRHFK